MLKEQDLDAQYTDDEYQDHIKQFNSDNDATYERFSEWVGEHSADLKRIYCRRVVEDEEMATQLSIIDWSQQMFIAWDYNTKKAEKIANEMKEMLGDY
jgi:glutathionylspermidine synthase